jgi:hypothetical protein
VPDDGAGATYAWSITGGSFDGPSDGRTVDFIPGDPGTLTLGVTITSPEGCPIVNSVELTVKKRFDPNGDGTVDPADIFYLVNYLYTAGPPPDGPAGLLSGDANGDGVVGPSDIFFLAHYLFSGGVAPEDTSPRVQTESLREPLSGSLGFGPAVRRDGRWFVPVVATIDPGSGSPGGVSLRVPLDGAVAASFTPDPLLHPTFLVARETGNGLYCLLAFGPGAPLIGGTTDTVVLGEIEFGGVAPARLEIDPALSMFVDAEGRDKATVANGRLRVEGTPVRRIAPPGRSPSMEHRPN